MIVVIITVILSLTASGIPLAQFIYPGRLIARMVDFFSALVMAVALGIFLRDFFKTKSRMVWWISLAVGISCLGQLLMSFSSSMFDAFFHTAHVYKVLSYSVMLAAFSLHLVSRIAKGKTVESQSREQQVHLESLVSEHTRALRDSEVRFRALTERGNELVGIIDKNGHYTYVSPSSRIYGYFPEEMCGKSPRHLFHPDDWYLFKKALLQAEQTPGDTVKIDDIRIRHKNGSWAWLEGVLTSLVDQPGINGTIFNGHDMTDRKETRNALQQSENKFKTLYNASMDAIMILTPDSRFISGNPAAVKLFACENEAAFIAMSPSDLSPGYQPDGSLSEDKSREYVQRVLVEGSCSFEWRHMRVGGEEFYATVLLTRMELRGEAVLQATVRDITDRKQAEQQHKILVSNIEEANKELEDFAYIVSHDLKAPLRGIISLVNWLVEDYSEKLEDEGREYLEKILKRGMNMNHLIDGILQYSRIGRTQPHPEPLNIEVILKEVIDGLHIPGGIQVKLETPFPSVIYDHVLLVQVFQNLIGNAVAHLGKPQGLITVSHQEANNAVEFCIKDNGIGIEERYFDRIFQVFQSLKTHAENSGIGLAMVKKIVERNGGRIRVESVVGEGSSFFFSIPGEASGWAALPQLTVLIIDDNTEFIDVATVMLKREGHRVISALSGHEACRLYGQYRTPIHMALMDLNIPGEDALDRYAAVRECLPGTKLIVCTGSGLSETIKRLCKKGLDGVLTKPFQLGDLYSIMSSSESEA
ncbi:MAG: PAS domain S-box protein [bacterium]|nr:PAS domain S-box protein [bacterium]